MLAPNFAAAQTEKIALMKHSSFTVSDLTLASIVVRPTFKRQAKASRTLIRHAVVDSFDVGLARGYEHTSRRIRIENCPARLR
jgi:hypothetical protein